MSRLRLLAVGLLIAGAALLAIGSAVEKGRHHTEATSPSGSSELNNQGGESAEQHAAESGGSSEVAPSAGGETPTNSGEAKVLGIDRESTVLVVLAVALSLALAALLLRRPSRAVWLTVGLVALFFAVFDIAEVIHQVHESAVGLALLAAAVAIAHGGVVAIAATDVTVGHNT